MISGEGRRPVLVVGGAGGMGSWFRRVLAGTGWVVEVVDPVPVGSGEAQFAALGGIRDLDRYDYVVLAVPLGATSEVLDRLTERRPRGVVVEIASLQGHLAAALARAGERAVRVVALHPMFGPGKPVGVEGESLRFVHAVQADAAAEEAAVRPLLAGLATSLVRVPLARHDDLMAWVLGLSHLLSLLFGGVLARCGADPSALAATASTTFALQTEVARGLLAESPDLYLDIQRLNPHREELYDTARSSLGEIERLVEAGDREGFRAFFAAARAALDNA